MHVVEAREKIRGDRGIGLTRGLYDLVYHDKIFDLIIDTSKMTPEESAQAILNYTVSDSKIGIMQGGGLRLYQAKPTQDKPIFESRAV